MTVVIPREVSIYNRQIAGVGDDVTDSTSTIPVPAGQKAEVYKVEVSYAWGTTAPAGHRATLRFGPSTTVATRFFITQTGPNMPLDGFSFGPPEGMAAVGGDGQDVFVDIAAGVVSNGGLQEVDVNIYYRLVSA